MMMRWQWGDIITVSFKGCECGPYRNLCFLRKGISDLTFPPLIHFTISCKFNIDNLYSRSLVTNRARVITQLCTPLIHTCVLPSVQSASVKARSVEMESVSSRKKAGCMRQENACLSMQDEQLISDLDAMQYDLATFKSQVWQPSLHRWFVWIKVL